MILHKREDLIADGFIETGIRINMADSRDVPAHGRIRKVAIALDVTQECLKCFRVSGVQWEIFYGKTGKVAGFKDVALLPA
jgi:hypothetical protein